MPNFFCKILLSGLFRCRTSVSQGGFSDSRPCRLRTVSGDTPSIPGGTQRSDDFRPAVSALVVGSADPLGGFTHSLADYVGNPGDELPVGGLTISHLAVSGTFFCAVLPKVFIRTGRLFGTPKGTAECHPSPHRERENLFCTPSHSIADPRCPPQCCVSD